MRRSRAIGIVVFGLIANLIIGMPVMAELSSTQIEQLREQGQREGWTFTVGENTATERSMDELCGLVVPDDWQEKAKFRSPAQSQLALPERFDLRELLGLFHGGCAGMQYQDP